MATSARVATAAYVPPGATAAPSSISWASQAGPTGSSTATAQIVDATGGVDSSSLTQYFTIPYIDAHTLSYPTWRYAYILWIAIGGGLVLWSIAYHLSGTRTGGSALGAWFRKWSVRRMTWTKRVGGGDAAVGASEKGDDAARGRKKVIWASPTYAQMICVAILIVVAVLASFAGDDYIKPTDCVFGGDCGWSGQNGPPKSNYRKRGANNPNGWAPFNDPLLAAPNFNIGFNAWTAAARLGLIGYAMLPLAVTLALKQWPFNLWATPFLTNYHFDKTAILHRWSGRVVWLFATGHAIGWMWQLTHDRDPFGRVVLVPAMGWYRFVCGIACWFLLTALTALSLKPIRKRYYELFYWSHVLLVLAVLGTAIVHHKPLMWWPIVALILWGAERAFRFASLLYLNGVFEGIWFRPSRSRGSRSSGGSFGIVREKGFDETLEQPFAIPPVDLSGTTHYPPSASPLPYANSIATSSPTLYGQPSAPAPRPLPPPGFANAQLLPGRTVRLTLRTPHTLQWAPGQHLLLYVPSVRLLESHPYTIACVADERSDKGGKTKGSTIVLLVRAQRGFSRALWDHVSRARGDSARARVQEGVELRALVSAPMGSAGRAKWGAYESVLIVCGGTGISFGIAVLEDVCRRMSASDSEGKGASRTRRVRFVWIMREYAHLSWVASTLRRCMEMCDSSQLQVDLYITHDAPKISSRSRAPKPYSAYEPSTDELAPPSAPFARQARSGSPAGRGSIASELSDWSDSDNEGGIRSNRSSRQYDGAAASLPDEYASQVDSVTDLVLFDGEDDNRTAGDAQVSAQLKKQGKILRALSRRGQGGSIRRPRVSAAASSSPALQAPSAVIPSEPSFEHLPLDHRDEDAASSKVALARPYDSPYDYPTTASLSYGDLGQLQRAESFDYPYGGGVDDGRSDVQTLNDGGPNSSMRNLVKAGARPGFSSTRTSFANLVGVAGAQAPADGSGAFFDLTDAEQDDLDAVAELAKTGYPRLKQIMSDEVERSAGKTVVACCGPSGLNSIVRNLVADSIDLRRVAKGDPRGQVSLVVEDFSN
ncbi:hypothetical protein Rhopal_003589-T1 [Rhodotorula paludigena]|uniref:ferric-chelate reductase (NADPH) n=1 Tax=Rhodotorula paludigena TaxID=86838 RepID=A0AAV5GNJ1_9BASI|nr:hypothetical protein Rhopal_003589-T1 [Rhodotorula paludigena]